MAQDMEQLYRRHYQTVYRYALRLTGSEHAAEELAAETFYRAMVALPDFRGECAASTWLCQIARNTAAEGGPVPAPGRHRRPAGQPGLCRRL